MSRKPYQLGRGSRKIAPKLRMIANGAAPINFVRAELCAPLAVAPSVDLAQKLQTTAAEILAVPAELPPRGSLAQPPAEILVNVFIATDSLQRLPGKLVTETGRVGSLVTATVPLSKLREIAGKEGVRSIAAGQQLKNPDPLVSSN